jgi:2-keto-3-deoxy-6-phosphogluconate aldolase
MSSAKNEVLGKIVASGLVAAIRAENPEQAAHIAEACAHGSAAALEITCTVPGATAWINAGAAAVGVAGNPTTGAKTGDFSSITQLARQFVEKIRQARGQ